MSILRPKRRLFLKGKEFKCKAEWLCVLFYLTL